MTDLPKDYFKPTAIMGKSPSEDVKSPAKPSGALLSGGSVEDLPSVIHGFVTEVKECGSVHIYRLPSTFLRFAASSFFPMSTYFLDKMKTDYLVIRPAGFDSPSRTYNRRLAEPLSASALKRLRDITEGRLVAIEPHRVDRYGRLVGTLFSHSRLAPLHLIDVAADIVKRGLGVVYNGHGDLSASRVQFLEYLQENAREKHLGIWTRVDGHYVQPKSHKRDPICPGALQVTRAPPTGNDIDFGTGLDSSKSPLLFSVCSQSSGQCDNCPLLLGETDPSVLSLCARATEMDPKELAALLASRTSSISRSGGGDGGGGSSSASTVAAGAGTPAGAGSRAGVLGSGPGSRADALGDSVQPLVYHYRRSPETGRFVAVPAAPSPYYMPHEAPAPLGQPAPAYYPYHYHATAAVATAAAAPPPPPPPSQPPPKVPHTDCMHPSPLVHFAESSAVGYHHHHHHHASLSYHPHPGHGHASSHGHTLHHYPTGPEPASNYMEVFDESPEEVLATAPAASVPPLGSTLPGGETADMGEDPHQPLMYYQYFVPSSHPVPFHDAPHFPGYPMYLSPGTGEYVAGPEGEAQPDGSSASPGAGEPTATAPPANASTDGGSSSGAAGAAASAGAATTGSAGAAAATPRPPASGPPGGSPAAMAAGLGAVAYHHQFAFPPPSQQHHMLTAAAPAQPSMHAGPPFAGTGFAPPAPHYYLHHRSYGTLAARPVSADGSSPVGLVSSMACMGRRFFSSMPALPGANSLSPSPSHMLALCRLPAGSRSALASALPRLAHRALLLLRR
ncbi:hypothetical protein H696_00954 [Fonticula alba]|uniref:TNase-like domain-containing protein n=1 Tax=Fonticula alba TaxID=691883 RepID=A0A058ZIS4_FONAL|nr:hypothetical protein H696_00954 [Fonticula alba]KCV73417.1 hypothetical protein H696_00954 [Fonticula alba]|eukprot:XP_009493118.1 hypothetical protein H696_00954 [Fonticula alba]